MMGTKDEVTREVLYGKDTIFFINNAPGQKNLIFVTFFVFLSMQNRLSMRVPTTQTI